MSQQHAGSKRSIPRFLSTLIGVFLLALAGAALADPPGRVARIGYVSGAVSFSPGGEDDWVAATLNRPLVAGDQLWSDNGARAELQIGIATIRLGAQTSATLLNLDDRVAQFQLVQGTLTVRVRRLDRDQVIEIDTPNLAYVIRRVGQYRISVDDDATTVWTSNGQGQVYGDGGTWVVEAGRAYRFYGTDLRDYENLSRPSLDEFDRWGQDRDRSYDNSVSARYVSRDVIGYQDLDTYGTWRRVPEYGDVWTPTRMRDDWAPYRDGHWAWVDPWGWTWVDDAPWGFAVSHYGRWASIGGSWGWIPGPIAARAVYAPALVAFIDVRQGGRTTGANGNGAVGWFPLGPRDVYRPGYKVSQTYFTRINVSNTVINNTTVINVYNNRNSARASYSNQQVAGAVIAVPRTAFVQSQPVSRAVLQGSRDAYSRAPVTATALVAPTPTSVRGAAQAGKRPPRQADEQRVIARSLPPPAPVGFAAKERALTANPGQPIDTATLAGMKPARPVAAPKVEVVAPIRNAGPVLSPPLREGRPNRRDGPASNREAATPGQRTPPAAAPAVQPPPSPPVVPPAAAPGKPADRASRERATSPVSLPPAPAAPVAPSPRPRDAAPPVETRPPRQDATPPGKTRDQPGRGAAQPRAPADDAQSPVPAAPPARNQAEPRKPIAAPPPVGAPVAPSAVPVPPVAAPAVAPAAPADRRRDRREPAAPQATPVAPPVAAPTAPAVPPAVVPRAAGAVPPAAAPGPVGVQDKSGRDKKEQDKKEKDKKERDKKDKDNKDGNADKDDDRKPR